MRSPRWRPLNFKYLYLSLYTREQRNYNGFIIVLRVGQHDETNAKTARRVNLWGLEDSAYELPVNGRLFLIHN